MQIPILRIPFDESDREFIHRHIENVLNSGMLTSGTYTRQFEEAFGEFCDIGNVVACANGTAAIELILRALGLRNKSIVIPTNTFMATALAVLNTGNRVIFADSDPATLCLTRAAVEGKLDEDTAAVIMVHIGGIVSPEVKAIKSLCDERGIFLIEDCAHAHGSSNEGQHAGTFGIAGAFSFFPTKVLTTGEGGAVITADDSLADEIRIQRNQGKDPNQGGHISRVGGNYRMNEFTAVVGVAQMNRASELIASRQNAAAYYDEMLSGVPGIAPLRLSAGAESSYYKYVAYLDEGIDREKLKLTLKENYQVAMTGEVYADLCHIEPVWRHHTFCGQPMRNGAAPRHITDGCRCMEQDLSFPGSEEIAARHVCPPAYAGLTESELEYVVTSIDRVIRDIGG